MKQFKKNGEWMFDTTIPQPETPPAPTSEFLQFIEILEPSAGIFTVKIGGKYWRTYVGLVRKFKSKERIMEILPKTMRKLVSEYEEREGELSND